MNDLIGEILYRIDELERKQANMFLYGTFKEYFEGDYTRAIIVLETGIESPPIPIAIPKSKGALEIWKFSPGEQVLVVSPGGDLRGASIVGTIPTKADAQKASELSSKEKVIVSDKSTISIEKNGNINLKTTGKVTVEASKVVLGGSEGEAVVTASHPCFLNGQPHSLASKVVFAAKEKKV